MITMQLLSGVSALLLAVLASHATAASFDCAKASNFAEKEICRDGFLSGRDEYLAKLYKEALTAIPEDQDVIRQKQREWLQQRNLCQTQKCLDDALNDRILVLERAPQEALGRRMEAQRQVELEQQRQAELKREAEAKAAYEARVEEERQRSLAQQQSQAAIVQQQQAANTAQQTTSVAPAPFTAATAYPQSKPAYSAPQLTRWQQFKNSPAWKYMLLVGAILTAWAMWRHHAGVTVIYNDYSDAAITNLLPAAGILFGGVVKWLELPHEIAIVAGLTGFMLALIFAVFASVRTNQGALSITLSMVAKITLVSVFYAVIAMLVASLFVNTKYKGESQARANSRNRREKKETMAKIVALASAYTVLTAWLCRRPEFTSLSECLEFDLSADPA